MEVLYIEEKEEILALLISLVKDLVNGKLKLIVETGRSGPYTVEELKEQLVDYGGTLTASPETDYKNLDLYEIDDKPEWMLEYELWVDGEKSDLTLTCTVRLTEKEKSIAIDSIHVL
ncbi:DUF7668 domain-containing protein [Planococcus salinarum]|uniref:DUF7668 domain-containing protein n=1 Tax=Planococcus salinarum TaxID=622695 RepID=UPI000E3B6B18|nr:hypothetical protein [Planococcus salinarum]TAA72667.1 hypothetical protein D2909_04625 [Planococcus salinarum]